ncbi:MAG TPA: RHS repeat-associated core domain-containing protein [Terriglobia bacterium]|nr:RHS repeat-associated core domain-containing protein [Terriglobia bacterium]
MSTVNDFAATPEYLLTSIDLPDGTSYSFEYETTPGNAPNVTGRIAKVTLPGTGSISYGYSGGNEGINCADGTTPILKRTVNTDSSNPWTYTHTENGNSWTTTLADPYGSFTTTYQFLDGYEIERQVVPTGGNALSTVYTCYNGTQPSPSNPCGLASITMPINEVTTLTQVPVTASSNLYSEVDTKYQTQGSVNYAYYGQPTDIYEYAYSTTAPPATKLRHTNVTYYQSLTGSFVYSPPQTVLIEDGSNNTVAETQYAYDSNANVSKITKTTNVSTSATISASFTYDTNVHKNGALLTATDFNGNTTNYTNGGCNYAFPTTIQGPSAGSYTPDYSVSYDTACAGAVVTQVTDTVNSFSTSYAYADPFWRLTEVTHPSGSNAWIEAAYTGATEVDTYTGMTATSPTTNCPAAASDATCRHDQSILDNLGRPSSVSLVNDPANGHTSTLSYGADGRMVLASYPGGASDSYAYDALNRVTSVTHADSNVAYTYYGAGIPTGGTNGGITNQLCPSGYGVGYPSLTQDESGNSYQRRQYWTDALGRLIEVDDVFTGDEKNGDQSLSKATCYLYDALNDLKQAYMNSGAQIRNYGYDALGRLTSSATPEAGTTSYSYTNSAGRPCSGDPSAVCSRTAPEENQPSTSTAVTVTTYTYDNLNRLTSKTYCTKPNAQSQTCTTDSSTSTVNFFYDQAPSAWPAWSGVSFGSYAKGKLVLTCTGTSTGSCGSSTSPPQAATAYEYDPLGNILSLWQCTPYNCGSSSIWSTPYTYDLAGDVSSWTHPSGFTATNSINTAQEITQIGQSPSDGTHPGNFVANATYTPWGALEQVENGCSGTSCNHIYETYAYNNRLQPVQLELGTTSLGSQYYCQVYNYYSGTSNPSTCTGSPTQSTIGNNGNIQGYYFNDPITTNPPFTHSATFTYDPLNRLYEASSSTSSIYYGYQFLYDLYGNLNTANVTQGSGDALSITVDNNSHITSSGYTYDAAGNLIDDGSHSYQWDAEGRLISEDNGTTESNIYNALGEEVEIKLSQYQVEQVFDASGQTLGEYNSTGWNNNGVPYWWPRWVRIGSHIVGYNVCCPEQTIFVHKDALDSTHMATDHAGNVLEDRLFYPWGQVWELSGTFEEQSFAGLDSADGGTWFYPAMFRQYNSTLGRWMSPDPADLAAVALTNPQSLNRYAYVMNNPTTLIDPRGLGPQQQTCGRPGTTVPQNYSPSVWCYNHMGIAGGSSPGAFFTNPFSAMDYYGIPVIAVVNTGIFIPGFSANQPQQIDTTLWSGDDLIGGSTSNLLGVNGSSGYPLYAEVQVGDASSFLNGLPSGFQTANSAPRIGPAPVPQNSGQQQKRQPQYKMSCGGSLAVLGIGAVTTGALVAGLFYAPELEPEIYNGIEGVLTIQHLSLLLGAPTAVLGEGAIATWQNCHP